MQKCGQLQASMAVALMAQSAADSLEWPALRLRRATTTSNAILCIEHPHSGTVCSLPGSACNSFQLCVRNLMECVIPSAGAFQQERGISLQSPLLVTNKPHKHGEGSSCWRC